MNANRANDSEQQQHTRATCICQEKTPLLNRRRKRRVHISRARPGIRRRRKRRFQRSPRTPIPPTQDASPRSRSRPSRVLESRARELRPSAPRIRTPEAYTGSSGHRSPGAPTDPRRRLPFGMPSVPLPLLRGSRTPQSGWLPRGIADAEQRGHVTAARESILYCIPTGSDMSASIILCSRFPKKSL